MDKPIKDLPPSKKKYYERIVQTNLIGNFIAATLSFYLLSFPINNQMIVLLNEPIMEAKSSSTLLLLSVVAPESKEKVGNNAAQLLLMDGTKRSKRDVQAFKQQAAMQDGRLSKCETAGKDWEQCFFYGTQPATFYDDGNNDDNYFLTPHKTSTSMIKISTW